VHKVVITPDGKWIIAAGEDGKVRRWDLQQCIMIKRACDELGIPPKSADSGTTIIS
jgi:WD40 repeat protein